MMRMPRSSAGEQALPLAILSAWGMPKEHVSVEKEQLTRYQGINAMSGSVLLVFRRIEPPGGK
jgi:hypothetical protein